MQVPGCICGDVRPFSVTVGWRPGEALNQPNPNPPLPVGIKSGPFGGLPKAPPAPLLSSPSFGCSPPPSPGAVEQPPGAASKVPQSRWLNREMKTKQHIIPPTRTPTPPSWPQDNLQRASQPCARPVIRIRFRGPRNTADQGHGRTEGHVSEGRTPDNDLVPGWAAAPGCPVTKPAPPDPVEALGGRRSVAPVCMCPCVSSRISTPTYQTAYTAHGRTD